MSFTGELTDELDSGDYITEFVSGGPKNYAYTTFKGKQTCKIRGFSLNYQNSKLLNFESVSDCVANIDPNHPQTHKSIKRKRTDTDDEEEPQAKIIATHNPSKITRDKYDHIIFNKSETKKYRVVYDKRVVLSNFDTVPFGY